MRITTQQSAREQLTKRLEELAQWLRAYQKAKK